MGSDNQYWLDVFSPRSFAAMHRDMVMVQSADPGYSLVDRSHSRLGYNGGDMHKMEIEIDLVSVSLFSFAQVYTHTHIYIYILNKPRFPTLGKLLE